MLFTKSLTMEYEKKYVEIFNSFKNQKLFTNNF